MIKKLVKEGDKVQAGQLILVLDNIQLSSQLDASKSQARYDKVNAERYQFLYEQGAASAKRRDAYATKAITSRDQVIADKANLNYKIDLNIYAQIGLVTLIGLAAKNGILIVEVAEQKLKEGKSSVMAVIESAESRLRPILMTATAALAGFLPLVVANGAGASAQQSLGTVIFGGLIVATVLSIGVVPPVYVLVKDLESRLMSPSK